MRATVVRFSDHYAALWSSLKTKPEIARVLDIINTKMTPQSQKRLTTLWSDTLKGGRDMRISDVVQLTHRHNAPQIWAAALDALSKSSEAVLGPAMDQLGARLGPPPASIVLRSLGPRVVTDRGFGLVIAKLPVQVLRDLLDPLARLACSPELLIALARRGAVASSQDTLGAVKGFSRDNKERYLDAVMASPRGLEGASPQLLRLLAVEFSDKLQAANVQVPAQEPQTLPMAHYNLKDGHLHNYSALLRCCARDTPADLSRLHESTKKFVPEAQHPMLLVGLLRGLAERGRGSGRGKKLARPYLEAVRKTSHPLLWNLALSATLDWALYDEMRQLKIPVHLTSMKALCSSGLLSDYRRLDSPPLEVSIYFLHRANACTLYKRQRLFEIFEYVLEAIETQQKREFGQTFRLNSSDLVTVLVWGSLRVSPKQPWKIMDVIQNHSELFDPQTLSNGIQRALEELQSDSKTAVHCRRNLRCSVEMLVAKFNNLELRQLSI